jgi:hypothetical protein
MAKYISRTGKDVILKFKGTEITVPSKGYYESQAEDLATLFPAHVRKVDLSEIIQEIERRLLPPNIKEVPTPNIAAITIPTVQRVELGKLGRVILNTPVEIHSAPIKEVMLKPESNKLITEAINGFANNTTDPDIKEFLLMISDILTEK